MNIYTKKKCRNCEVIKNYTLYDDKAFADFTFIDIEDMEKDKCRVILEWVEHNNVKSFPFGIDELGNVVNYEQLLELSQIKAGFRNG